MVATQDYTWEQGDDLIIEIVYKVNDVAVDLTAGEGFSVRMDIAPLLNNVPQAPVFSFNSDDFDGGGLDVVGAADNEVVFPSTPGTIHVVVPRGLTLGAGAIASELSSTNVFGYDLFLRDKGLDTQKKLVKGQITVNRSITQWA